MLKIPSMRITEIAKTIVPKAKHKIIGIRPGEKLHEQMIGLEDSDYTYEYKDYYKIFPQINDWDKNIIKRGKKSFKNFTYSSDNNSDWMTQERLKKWLSLNQNI